MIISNCPPASPPSSTRMGLLIAGCHMIIMMIIRTDESYMHGSCKRTSELSSHDLCTTVLYKDLKAIKPITVSTLKMRPGLVQLTSALVF